MVRPKKHLGQHFLRDENIARKIIGQIPEDVVNILEIGPGTGVLSKYILEDERFNPYFIEIDIESIEYLRASFPLIAKKLINADFLEADMDEFPAPLTVIGNFPYNISSQILFKVLEHRNTIPHVIGMFQKEVAERISSPPGSKKYGILSVLLRAFYDTEYLFTVNEGCFHPPPKVKSAVIRLHRNDVGALNCDEKLFFRVVKTAFNQRRKTLRNALGAFSFRTLSKNDAILGKRAEQLSVEDFIRITNDVIFTGG